MAKLDKTVCPGFEKKQGEDWNAFHERAKGLLSDLTRRSAKIEVTSDKLVGAVLQFSVADGYALYVVTCEEPLTLQHIPFMDAYQADAATVRGVVRSTVREHLRRVAFLNGLGDKTDTFYSSLKIGQTVHYHNSFGAYVRCEVVASPDAAPGRRGKSGRALLPKALVGAWGTHDRVSRLPDGTVHNPYHVTSILNAETMTPNESCIWECPDFAHRGQLPDPTEMEPLPLTVPEMTPAEYNIAKQWQKVNRIRNLVNNHENTDPDTDPGVVLAAVRSMVAP